MIEAVVFDLDGVLIETEELWDEVREQLAREVGARYDEAAQRTMMGGGEDSEALRARPFDLPLPETHRTVLSGQSGGRLRGDRSMSRCIARIWPALNRFGRGEPAGSGIGNTPKDQHPTILHATKIAARRSSNIWHSVHP